MNYTQLKEFLPQSEFIYVDVTVEEMDAIPYSIYMTEFDGIRYVGTSIEVEALKDKQIFPTKEEIAAQEALLAEKVRLAEEAAANALPIEEVVQP